ncbi:uncharacterized protein LOC128337380 isoform X2 [Hemicordylus capensis]|uniref:uncharacterized protein LOC128337380 isoform X2 n=1 Tax=Hemicordylus capensis TaxID=884348 RepID=UPI0023036185|nr:uncharacterized protein LOC128337380 isoform X2 [Hemicordylus capensis]
MAVPLGSGPMIKPRVAPGIRRPAWSVASAEPGGTMAPSPAKPVKPSLREASAAGVYTTAPRTGTASSRGRLATSAVTAGCRSASGAAWTHQPSGDAVERARRSEECPHMIMIRVRRTSEEQPKALRHPTRGLAHPHGKASRQPGPGSSGPCVALSTAVLGRAGQADVLRAGGFHTSRSKEAFPRDSGGAIRLSAHPHLQTRGRAMATFGVSHFSLSPYLSTM